MPSHRTLALVCALAATAAALILAGVVTLDRPEIVKPHEVEHLEVGARVRVEGRLSEEGLRDGGSFATLSLEDGTGGSVRVFLGFPPGDIAAGDRIRVTGTIAMFRGEPEVVVEHRDDLEVMGGPLRRTADLGGVLAMPAKYREDEVRVTVVVASAPVMDPSGSSAWCLLADPQGMEPSVRALAQVPWELVLEGWEVGRELDLGVVARYDASTGLVYLEVVGVTRP